MPEKGKSKHTPWVGIAEAIYPYFPDLKKRLLLADLRDEPVPFIERMLSNSLLWALTLGVGTAAFLYATKTNLLFALPLLVIYLFGMFQYFMFYPEAVIIRRKRDLDYEVLFAGRHLVIALKSGMPLFDGMVGVTSGYGAISREFNRIVEKVSLGTPLSQAIREVAHNSPSQYFVQVLMQIANSLSSGADVGQSVEIVTEQIAREQLIQLKEYGQKLTPMVMFFMVLGIIIPSLGVVILTVLFSFAGQEALRGLPSYILPLVLAGIGIVQFLFLGLVESSRPKYLM